MKDYKLKLLQSYGIGRLIKDFCLISNINLTDNEIYKNIISLEKKIFDGNRKKRIFN